MNPKKPVAVKTPKAPKPPKLTKEQKKSLEANVLARKKKDELFKANVEFAGELEKFIKNYGERKNVKLALTKAAIFGVKSSIAMKDEPVKHQAVSEVMVLTIGVSLKKDPMSTLVSEGRRQILSRLFQNMTDRQF